MNVANAFLNNVIMYLDGTNLVTIIVRKEINNKSDFSNLKILTTTAIEKLKLANQFLISSCF